MGGADVAAHDAMVSDQCDVRTDIENGLPCEAEGVDAVIVDHFETARAELENDAKGPIINGAHAQPG